MQTAMPRRRRGLVGWLEDRGPLLVAAFVTLPVWYAGFDKPDWFYPPGYCRVIVVEEEFPETQSLRPDDRWRDEWPE